MSKILPHLGSSYGNNVQRDFIPAEIWSFNVGNNIISYYGKQFYIIFASANT